MLKWAIAKSKCHNSKSIVTRFQIVGEICCATTIFDSRSLLVAVLQAEFDFKRSKVQSLDRQSCLLYLDCGVLQIDGLVIYEGLKRKSGSLMLKFLLPIRTKWFGFGLFQQIRVPNEYRALPSEKPFQDIRLTSDYIQLESTSTSVKPNNRRNIVFSILMFSFLIFVIFNIQDTRSAVK